MPLRFCAVQFRGCGHIWEVDREVLEIESKDPDTPLVVCPECDRDCHLQLTEENIEHLADPSTIDKAKTILESYLKMRKALDQN
jgi:hypothetical protein